MKLATIAFLPAVVLGSTGHVSRQAQVSTVWAITEPSDDPVAYDETEGLFTVEFDHGTAGSNFVEIFAAPGSFVPSTGNILDSCKTRGGVSQGKFYATAGSSVDWLDETFTVSAEEILSTYQFSINEDIVTAGATIYEDPDGAANADETIVFCIFFGKTDDFRADPTTLTDGNPDTYGPTVTFVEIAMKVTFTFDGIFALSDFETKALDPASDDATLDFSVDVYRCPGSPSMYNQLQVIPICVCPSATPTNGPIVSVARIQDMLFAKRDAEFDPTSLETLTVQWETVKDTNDPILDIDGNVGLLAISEGKPMTGSVAVTCDPDGTSTSITNYCCQIDILLGELFFPAPGLANGGEFDSTPAALALGAAVETHVAMIGEAYMQVGSALDGTFEVGNEDGPLRRRLVRAKINNKLGVDRALQEATSESDLVEEEFQGDLDFVAVPLEDSSAAGNALSYLAIATVTVAALLL